MPWTNQAQNLIILTEADTGFSGLFGYSPSPGPGNLRLSSAAASGTDPYGNAYLSGTATYLPGSPFVAAVLDGGNMTYYTAAAYGGPWNVVGTIDQGTPSGYAGLRMQILDGAASATAYLLSDGLSSWLVTGNADDGTIIAAQNPVTGVPETWQPLGPLSQTGIDITTAQYRMQPDGNVRLNIKGAATASVATGAKSFPNAMPPGYQPGTITVVPAAYDGAVAAGENRPHAKINTAGVVTLYWPGLAAGNDIGVQAEFTI